MYRKEKDGNVKRVSHGHGQGILILYEAREKKKKQ